ncbi:hypothetical protein KKA14_20930, partial [bacterium]|nr:hypothetical protein [bacterium]
FLLVAVISRTSTGIGWWYSWPGNIRELKSVLEYAFVVAEEGLIKPDQLPQNIIKPEDSISARSNQVTRSNQENGNSHSDTINSNSNDPREKTELVSALNQAKGNQSEAARILGISRVTVWNRMKKYNIDLKRMLVS